MVRVLLGIDHQVVREGVRAMLESAGLEVVDEASDHESTVRLAGIHAPDVAVLDLAEPAAVIACAREIIANDPKVGVVLLFPDADEEQVIAALHAGVRGYVVKTQTAADFVQAIREVNAGGVYLAAKAARVVAKAYVDGASAHDPLPPRLREVLRLIALGKSTKEIAASVGVSDKTAELYRSRVMARLDIHTTAGLVLYALRCGILEP